MTADRRQGAVSESVSHSFFLPFASLTVREGTSLTHSTFVSFLSLSFPYHLSTNDSERKERVMTGEEKGKERVCE